MLAVFNFDYRIRRMQYTIAARMYGVQAIVRLLSTPNLLRSCQTRLLATLVFYTWS